MERIRVEFPEPAVFAIVLPVRITDINYGQHLGNDAVLAFAHEARVRFLQQGGLSEKNVGDGVGLIMVDAAISFRAQARWGDEIKIEVGQGELTPVGFVLFYRLRRIADNADIAIVRTGLVFYDYAQQRLARRIPEAFRNWWQSLRATVRSASTG